jgi:hypothetical protein
MAAEYWKAEMAMNTPMEGHWLRILWMLTFFVGSTFVQLTNGHCEGPRAEPVSIISLIAQPRTYDGKNVVVTGYLSFGWERSFLFLSPYDAQVFDSNAIFLDIGNAALGHPREHRESENTPTKQWALLDHETVDVEGTFYYPEKGEGDYWSGYPNGIITNITGMQLHEIHPSLPLSETPKEK